ncbi:hypothetical protein [Arenimonas fontis]|uniref:Uncharacterized protein n=1 Tax=Arenimonas fontis TaxID=2608255 RepID=A0A5B2Z8V7_9GAMM|nr:hypothetical protein [Arenimonas fontis]KAA2283953.1 hypothetical protein F0415_11655 [Arenimonas fontis]
MRLSTARAAVAAAEAECRRARTRAEHSWAGLRSELGRAATPGRIVVGGLGLGFVAGKAGPEAVGAARLAGPMFELLGQTLLPGLMAGLAAATADLGEDGGEEDGESAPDPDEDATEEADGCPGEGTAGDADRDAGDSGRRRPR